MMEDYLDIPDNIDQQITETYEYDASLKPYRYTRLKTSYDTNFSKYEIINREKNKTVW